MKKIIFSFLFLGIFSFSTLAQENLQDNYVDGNKYSIAVTSEMYKKVIKVRPKTTLKKHIGFAGYIESGVGIHHNCCTSANLNMILGYRLNQKLFMGLGTGIEGAIDESTFYHGQSFTSEIGYYAELLDSDVYCKYDRCNYALELYIPVYFNIRYDFLNRLCSPVIGASIGTMVPTHGMPGFLLEGIIGVDFHINKRIPIGINIKPRLQTGYIEYFNIEYFDSIHSFGSDECGIWYGHYHYEKNQGPIFAINFNLSVGF